MTRARKPRSAKPAPTESALVPIAARIGSSLAFYVLLVLVLLFLLERQPSSFIYVSF